MASSLASGRARDRVESALTAAVRIPVTAAESRTARSSPVAPSMSKTAPWCASRPRVGLSGTMQRTLTAKRAFGAERCAGIQTRNRAADGGTKPLRSGCDSLPRARSARTAAIASMQAAIGRRFSTSARPRTVITGASCRWGRHGSIGGRRVILVVVRKRFATLVLFGLLGAACGGSPALAGLPHPNKTAAAGIAVGAAAAATIADPTAAQRMKEAGAPPSERKPVDVHETIPPDVFDQMDKADKADEAAKASGDDDQRP